MLFDWNETPQTGEDLTMQLQRAVKDRYQRHGQKTGRYRPDYKDQPSASKPIIRTATPKQIQTLRECINQMAA